MPPWETETGFDEIEDRLESLSVTIREEEWLALPIAARKRLHQHPVETESDRRRLAELARWLLREFPPGWSDRRGS